MALTASSSVGVVVVIVVSAVLLFLLADAPFLHASLDGRRVLSSDGEAGRGSTVASWRRSIAESAPPGASLSSYPRNNSHALAAARTHRSDPLANFTMYDGGWNISDQHYWASVAFTGIPFFLIAGLWLVGFGIALLVISCCFCFCRNKSNRYSPTSYRTTLILLIILTCATVVGCGMLEKGQQLFYFSTIGTVEYIARQGGLTVEKLRDFAGSLAAAKDIGVDQIFLPVDVQLKIDVIEDKLNSSANEFSARIAQNSDEMKNVMARMQYYLMALGAIMLGVALLGFLFSVLGVRFLVSLMVIAGWVLLAVTMCIGGGFILLHNVVSDTCMAVDEWVARPQAHTALDDILPCMDVATANEGMYRSQEVTAQLVALVNNVIVNISNREFPPALKPLYFNQSGPLMPVLCNPFNRDMTERDCAAGEVTFNTAPGQWKRFECQVTGPPGSETCATQGRVTPAAYNQMTAATSVSMGLYQFGPFLTQLQDCSFVRETFMSISRDHCPGLERYSRLVYAGLLVISVAGMISLVLWMLHTRQRRWRARSMQV